MPSHRLRSGQTRAPRLSWLIVLLLLAGLAAVPAAGAQDYFPLRAGTRLVLRNPHSREPIVWSTESVDGDVVKIGFSNPWLNSTLTFQRVGASLRLQTLSIHGLDAPMPPNTVYFDFAAPVGRTWTNRSGTLQVVSRTLSVAGYSNCIQFSELNQQKQVNTWTFAPGVGLVQFGIGDGAFVLTGESRLPQPAPAEPSRPPMQAGAPSRQTPVNHGWGPARVALANNPAANEWLTPWSVNRRFDQAVRAGVSFVYLCPKWDELEPSPGKYRFDDLDFQVDQAVRANLPLVLHVRIVDTNRSTMPSDLQGKRFDDQAVRARFLHLLDLLAPHLKGRVAYCLFGNEIDSYFSTHQSAVLPYAELFRDARARAQQLFNGAPTSVTVTFDAVTASSALLVPILQLGDFLSVTYYPLQPNFTVRDPSVVVPDLERMMRAAGNKRILLQEVGYPSSPENNSSEAKQAEVLSRILKAVASARDRFIGVNILFMCNLSDKVTEDLAQGFDVAGKTRFRSYLQTLGLFYEKGRPKKSWSVFESRAKLVP